jgi:hypothetical protein
MLVYSVNEQVEISAFTIVLIKVLIKYDNSEVTVILGGANQNLERV